jgi:hypothetical protein
VKQTIAVYLRNYVRKIIDTQYASLTSADVQEIINSVYQTLISETLDLNSKRHCLLVFESLMNIYMNKEQNQQTV